MRFITMFFIVFYAFQANADQTVFRVAYGVQGTTPYYNGNGKRVPVDKPGLVIELLNLIAKDLDLDVKFIRLPWNDVLSSLAENKVDAIFDASFNAARQKIGRYPTKHDKVDGDNHCIVAVMFSFTKRKPQLIGMV